MLRDPLVAALNELAVRCQDAVLRYRDAEEVVAEQGLRDLLHELAAQRQAAIDTLAQAVRERDDLPDAPDADRETLRRAVAFTRAAAAEDAAELAAAVSREIMVIEEGIARQSEEVLALAPSGEARQLAERLVASAEAARSRVA